MNCALKTVIMDSQNDSLLSKISSEDKEFGRILEDVGITEDGDIQSLCYEALKDIYPGDGKRIVQRSKVWRVIQKSLKSGQTGASSPSTSGPSTSSGYLDLTDENADHRSSSFVESEILQVSTPKPAAKRIKVECPDYAIYADSEILAGAKAGKLSREARNRLVRGTIHNMTAAASCPPFCRLPKTFELEEMSKSLVIAYPCLRDPETGHGVLFKQLKRRLSNGQPTKNPQGPCPNKKGSHGKKEKENGKNNTVEVTGEDNLDEDETEHQSKHSVTENTCISQPNRCSSSSNSVNVDDHHDDGDEIDSPEVMSRHYQAIKKEMEKKKPNVEIINMYLNKEFQARRAWLQVVPAEERCNELLAAYSCFKDHVEVIEESRRVLRIESAGRCQFMKNCVEQLVEEVDMLIFYGIHSKGINPPRSLKLKTKIVHVLQSLSSIFPRQKVSKKPVELVHKLKDHEDPNSWSSVRVGNIPVMVYDEDFVYVFVGSRILFKTAAEKIPEAVIAFLASFYLLDFDYPKQHEIGMNILQVFIFNDNRTPKDISVPFNSMLKAYSKYRADC